MVKVQVDYENNAEEWWEAARDAAGAPAGIVSLLDNVGQDSVYLSDTAAEDVRRWAASLPGWDGGPEYAPHPLIIDTEAAS